MGYIEPSKKGFQTLPDGGYEPQYQSYHIDPSNNYNNYDYNPQQPHVVNPPSEKKAKKRCCCCCCRSRASKIGCSVASVLILIAIGIAAFFCAPRGMPKVKFQDATFPNIQQTESQFKSWLAAHSLNIEDLKINIDTDLHLHVTNPNYISIKMKNITVVGDYKLEDGVAVQVGQGALAHSVTFKARGSTNFTLPFNLSYDGSNKESVPALWGLLSNCGFLSEVAEEKFDIEYKAKLDITLISWTGFKPTIRNTVRIACPIKGSNTPNIAEIRDMLNYAKKLY